LEKLTKVPSGAVALLVRTSGAWGKCAPIERATSKKAQLNKADFRGANGNRTRTLKPRFFSNEIRRRYTPMAATNAFQRLARKAKDYR
jgi:hypothetical protein